jgi:hypothetical protein
MRLSGAIGLALLALAGCGGGDGDTDARRAQRAIEPAAQERAEAALLKLSDLPDGWRADTPDEDQTGQDAFYRCVDIDFSALTITGEAASKDFTKGENTEVSSGATVFASDAEAEQALEEFATGMTGEKTNECFRDVMEKRVGGRFEIGDVKFGELSFTPPPDLDEASAWELSVPIEVIAPEGEGSSVTAYLDLVYLRKGDTLGAVEASDVVTPFDSQLRDELVELVAQRLSANG